MFFRPFIVYEAAFAPPGALLGMSVQPFQAARPALYRTWCFAMLESPASAQASVARVFPSAAEKPAGFAGVTGTAGATSAASDAGPAPVAFTARRSKA